MKGSGRARWEEGPGGVLEGPAEEGPPPPLGREGAESFSFAPSSTYAPVKPFLRVDKDKVRLALPASLSSDWAGGWSLAESCSWAEELDLTPPDPLLPPLRLGLLQVQIYNPAFFKYIHDRWTEHHGRYPSTGMLALFFALHVCDEVSFELAKK